MPAFISEDDIEKTLLDRLSKFPFDYNIIKCDPSPDKRDDLNDGTFRTDKKQCVLPNVLLKKLKELNPNVQTNQLEKFYKEVCLKDYSDDDLTSANYKLYGYIRNQKKVEFTNNDAEDFDFIKLIDFDNPKNNEFTAVSQMWIKGRYYYHRPDVIVFVNGLPLIFIELKNSTVKVREAYDKNLKNYLGDCPNLFAFNQVCVLSNGLETRLGAYNADYGFFFEWLKEKESDAVDRKLIRDEGISIEYLINDFLKPEILLDYIENFIVFSNKSTKIIAKNHQFLGVNNLFESLKNRKKLNGKLGVFWHTQGSGKSYSMVFFVRKVQKKMSGNFTYLIVTDREELDTQIHKTFVRTDVIGPKDETQPKNSEQLREFLQGNKPILFTMIHKFRYDKGKKYPILSTRDDIVVLVDEAHRTQYKDLAENMRTGLPKANYVAFTGTPLLGSKRLTNQWFGDYVSEYNFADSVADGSTVPLFYSRRVPEVWLNNDFLDDDVLDIIENDNLTDAETRALENSSSRIIEVIKRDSRLDKIAQDIAHHFPRRGYLGKGMVVSVDKFTAVKMYNKVKHYWDIEKRAIVEERNQTTDKAKRDELTKILDFMNTTEMAVVISEDANEIEKFREQGLDFKPFRDRINYIDGDGKDIEDQFKDPNNKFRLVFVCSMWLTGFDVPTLSTLYLDKPMKNHTLMQAIARCNRVADGKQCGIIVDYINIFKYMTRALKDYAEADDNDMPIKNMEELIDKLNSAISETDKFLEDIGVSLSKIIEIEDTYERLETLRQALNTIVSNDETKDKFKVLSNLVISLYEASKPEIFEMHFDNPKFAPINYLNGLYNNTIDDEKLAKARQKMKEVLDNSVETEDATKNEGSYAFKDNQVIDLSKLNLDDLEKRIQQSPYKALNYEDLRAFIEKALEQMINRNQTRIKFSERYKNIIDNYNAGSTNSEEYFKQLKEYLASLQEEEKRAEKEGLTEAELEIYDLLTSNKKLTSEEEKKVKLAAKNLYLKLKENKERLLVVDWYKDEQPMTRVRSAIEEELDKDLPLSYDKDSFIDKTNLIMNMLIDKTVQGIQIFY